MVISWLYLVEKVWSTKVYLSNPKLGSDTSIFVDPIFSFHMYMCVYIIVNNHFTTSFYFRSGDAIYHEEKNHKEVAKHH